jgi:hypothetical protein
VKPGPRPRDPARRRFLGNAAGLSAVALLPSGCAEELPLPAPTPVPWKMKPLSSAKTEMRTLADGRLFLSIRHEVLRGVTPAMLAWWFANLEGNMTVAGKTVTRYRVWHPEDHIAIRYARRRPDGTIGPGAQIHIQEALGRRPGHQVDVVTTIEKLDETGFVHVLRQAGPEILRLQYAFTPVKDGTLYENSIVVGPDGPLARPVFNSLIRPHVFPDERARAWLKHNVEEVGNFEHFLPQLHASRAAGGERSRP